MNFKVQNNIALAPLSTFQIGGVVREYIQVESPEGLVEIVEWANEENKPFRVFAGGSNVVFPDEGVQDLVVQVKGGKYAGNMRELVVDAGVDLVQVVSYSIGQGWKGLESLSGIPGTVGGAIVGNAGAYGHSISEVVEKVEVLDGDKRCFINKEECSFSYRESVFKQKSYLILRVVLKFELGNREELEKTSKEIIKKREVKYHPGIKCPGSFFKNIIASDLNEEQLRNIEKNKIVYGKIPAGYLLEEVGVKGMRVGGIEIADYHGNLFINKGNGTASQVKKLAAILKDKVREKFGIELEEEIRYF
ncbi:UDP-N-acetylenolpyruvoylglucosamine reductase [Candidatus Gottesmanbacteria bacterium RIFCSPHIGHO2_01_FULL_39_10]|uniref:UDP-N-acetylenolpyruvoylglucosamine reductase n=1 Tax=Candidatus Gottesmanbacteria bacterium RIFCSPHIGHO2_01_FULL_39_10 TaxID=1798375 RepID=A0A1F5ZQC8_9BACT|nr:MAG: UDP-N-acetylenolpyruvoylglucosamine reductase [Candidatus Gottesmanbacteria bacterium RIFCSPHIGHO2_01_FULL_39_10]